MERAVDIDSPDRPSGRSAGRQATCSHGCGAKIPTTGPRQEQEFLCKDAKPLPSYALTIANEEHLTDFLEEAQEIMAPCNQALLRAERTRTTLT